MIVIVIVIINLNLSSSGKGRSSFLRGADPVHDYDQIENDDFWTNNLRENVI